MAMTAIACVRKNVCLHNASFALQERPQSRFDKLIESVTVSTCKWAPKILTKNREGEVVTLYTFMQFHVGSLFLFPNIHEQSDFVKGSSEQTVGRTENYRNCWLTRIWLQDTCNYPPYQGNAETPTLSDVTGPEKVPDLMGPPGVGAKSGTFLGPVTSLNVGVLGFP